MTDMIFKQMALTMCNNPVMRMTLKQFIMLDTEDFYTLFQFKDDDWMSFGACKEDEHFCNRNDWKDGNTEGWEILSEKQFNEVKIYNPSTLLTYQLYLELRKIENK